MKTLKSGSSGCCWSEYGLRALLIQLLINFTTGTADLSMTIEQRSGSQAREEAVKCVYIDRKQLAQSSICDRSAPQLIVFFETSLNDGYGSCAY